VIDGVGIAASAGARENPRARDWPALLRETTPVLPEDFPGRWNPRRALPPDLDPLPAAAALALEDAGWWKRGTGQGCEGALVIASDRASFLPAARFVRSLRDGAAPSPSDFLFALPSSAAAVLGMLFGLTSYQATAVGGPLAGRTALGHALDLLRLRREERVLVAALGAAPGPGPPLRLAAALCLRAEGAARYPVRVEIRGNALHLERGAGEKRLRPEDASASWAFQDPASRALACAARWLEMGREDQIDGSP
jgi:hypothetical protein